MQPNFENLEQDLITLMDWMLKGMQSVYPEIPEQLLRQKIVASNLKGMVNVILIGDDPETPVRVNLKALCLGLLAAADWLDPEEVSDDVVPGNATGFEG